ncbi:MAG: O-antigen ligase family protein [Devosia sp.]
MTVSGTFDAAPGSKWAGADFVRQRALKLLDGVVALWIFAGGIVLIEPSPYEVMFLLVLPVAIMAGIGLYRSTFGLLAIMLCFTPFGLIAAMQVRFTPISEALMFTAVTIFLMLTSYFVANYLAESTEKRMRVIMRAYTAIAVILAIIGTLAYLRIMPGADLFLRYDRAKATFKDPNVYAPFLVLPAMFALQRVLLGRGWQSFMAGGVYFVLFVGVFVSFSRGGWGHFAASSLITLVLVFLLEAGARDKVRILLMTLIGAGMLIVALGGLLSVPAVADFFELRASSQNYDTGETGRFGRQGYALELALDNPWGIGPGEFRNLRIVEEPHNVYITVFHVYGWGGGLLYYLMIIATLWKGTVMLMRPSPYRLMAIPVMATFTMVVAESAIIDSDHWRHFFLLIGLVWGLSTAIANEHRGSARREQMLV